MYSIILMNKGNEWQWNDNSNVVIIILKIIMAKAIMKMWK